MMEMETVLILMNAIRVRLVPIQMNVLILMAVTLVNVVLFINRKLVVLSMSEIFLIEYAKVQPVSQLTHVTVVSVQQVRLVQIFILTFPAATINQFVNVQLATYLTIQTK